MKLNIAYIGDKCHEFMEMSLDSVIEECNKLIFVWGKEEKRVKNIILKYKKKYPNKIVLIEHDYQHKDRGANGKQRNVYLDYLKKHHQSEWCLVLDPDEVVNDIKLLKTLLPKLDKNLIVNPNMIHFIYNLGWEDATKEEHFVPGRLFNVGDDLYYEEVEHPVLQSSIQRPYMDFETSPMFTIYHLSYAKTMFELLNKYETHLAKSEMHTEQFLKWWYHSHIAGEYPVKRLDITTLPDVIKKAFKIDEEYLYFKNRSALEVKHWLDAWIWKDHFKPEKVLMCGVGMGHRVFTLNAMDIHAEGFDISRWAIENTPYQSIKDKLFVESITGDFLSDGYDLVVAYDILEHLTYEDLDKALKNIYKWGTKSFVFSMPFIGDPNLEMDNTHIIKETKEWWINKIEEHGFNVVATPANFMFAHQIIIAEKIK